MSDDDWPNDWGPWSLRTSTRPSRDVAWPTGSVIPIDVDDQAPIPLLVSIALLLVIGFIIIVYCICRRHNLLGGSSGPQDPNAAYQRAPTGDGTGGGYCAGIGGNSYPMAPVKPMFPPAPGPPHGSLPGKTVMAGGVTIGQHLQPPQQHPYPTLPPDAYTPPYPVGYTPLPSYMPTSQSSHTSSASGPSSDQGPSGVSSSSPPGPAPAPSGMVMATPAGDGDPSQESVEELSPGVPEAKEETESEGVDTSVANQGFNPLRMVYANPGCTGYASQGVQDQVPGGVVGQGMAMTGFQESVMGMGGGQRFGYGGDFGGQSSTTQGLSYTLTMHPTAMDYAPGRVGFVPRVGSPMPPQLGTTITELDQL